MSHIRRRPRLPLERSRASAPSDNRVMVAYTLLGLFAFIGAIVAIAADELALRFLMAGVAVFMVLSVAFMAVLQQGRARGFVGFKSAGPLTFGPGIAFYGLQVAMAVVGIVTGLGTLIIDPGMGRGRGSIWIGTFAVGAAIWLITQLVSFRLPEGLCVTEDGLTGVRGVGRRVFGWDEIVNATPEIDGREVALGITDVHGLATNVGASYYLGSDPAVVAQVINYFLEHPEERHLLNDPLAAIRRVEQAARAAESAESLPESSDLAAAASATTAESAPIQQEYLAGELEDALEVEAVDSASGWGTWPPARGWWWRWPVIGVAVFSWVALFGFVVLAGEGDNVWIALVFYSVLAVAGTWLLLWHRKVRARDSRPTLGPDSYPQIWTEP